MRSVKDFQVTVFFVMLVLTSLTFSASPLAAQEKKDKTPDDSYRPILLKLNEEGDKYIRLIMWHQVWATTNNLAAEQSKLQASVSIRRSRFLAFAQVSQKFLILTHWGLNGLDNNNLTSLGNNGDSPQIFLHGAWTEFKVSDQLYLGGGLHYWNGLTRLASASTLNFMTMDQSRPFVHWHSLGVTDQFGRHLGVYAKGQIGKFDYRLAVNTPGKSPLGGGKDYGGQSNLTYTGISTPKAADDLNNGGQPTGNGLFTGYLRYNFWEPESIKLPYQVGSYLGAKKVLGLGAGFFLHPNGMYDNAAGRHEHVAHFAVDAFLDLPTSTGGWTAYAAYMHFDYGQKYMSRWAGTGTVLYAQAGYYLRSAKIMPYFSFQHGNYEAFDKPLLATDIGLNYFINGHNAKLTLEYHHIANNPLEGGVGADGAPVDVRQIRLQAQVFL